ncbi:MAG: ATP synthase F0 subunit B [Acidimicrobiia bacterium]
MRTPVRLATGAVLAAGLVLGVAGPAGAAKLSEVAHCNVEAVEKHAPQGVGALSPAQVEELNTAIENCAKAPNPLLPATNEIIWGGIGFLVVLVFISKFGFPAVKRGMEARTERIRESLDDAERTRAEAHATLEEYQRQLAEARTEAAQIIEEARQAADALRRELMSKAEADAQAVRERAQADIAAAVERATADLRRQVADLAIRATEMILQRELADREAQVRLVEEYIASVGSRS